MTLAVEARRRDPRGMTENERVTKLEAQIADLESKQTELYDQLAEARLDQWKGRLEDLEVQVHLGAMDTNDRIAALMQKAHDRWDDARRQVGGATATAAGAAFALGSQAAKEPVALAAMASATAGVMAAHGSCEGLAGTISSPAKRFTRLPDGSDTSRT